MNKNYSELKNYRAEIDGLRGFAILNIIIFHLKPNFLPNGFLGVDIFFVISGFLITSSIQTGIKSFNLKFIPFIKSFYKKRFLRIFPSLIIYFLLFFSITLFFNPDPGISIRTGLSSLIGLSNLYLSNTNLTYFGHELSSNPFLITWSLSLELQFYLFFPLLVFFITKFSSAKCLKFTLIFLSFLSILFFLFNQDLYFSPLTRIWGIIIGSLAFFYSRNILNLSCKTILLNLILLVIILSVFLKFKFIFINHLTIVSLSSILLIIQHKNNSLIYKLLKSKILIAIGKRSYSLFLWHWGIITLFFWFGWTINFLSIIFYFALTLIFSELNYQFIEKSFLSKREYNLNSNLLIFCLSIPLLLFYSLKNRHRLLDLGTNLTPGINKTAQYIDPNLDLEDKYFKLIPKLYRKNYDSNGILKTNTKTLFLIGDSHVSNHIPSILKAIHELDESISLVKIKGSFFSKDSNPKYTNYFEKVNFLMKSLSDSIDYGDILVFSTDFKDLKDKKGLLSEKALFEMNQNLEKIIKISIQKKSNLVLVDLLPIPCLGVGSNYIGDIESEILKPRNKILKLKEAIEIRATCDYPLEILSKYRTEMTKIYRNLALSNSNVDYLDFSDELCPKEICSPIDSNNKIIYVDQSPHISIENKFILKGKWKYYLRNLLK